MVKQCQNNFPADDLTPFGKPHVTFSVAKRSLGRVDSQTKGPRQLGGATIIHGLSPRKLENVKNAG